MATKVRTIKLPNGKILKVKAPEEWGADQLRARLEQDGVDFSAAEAGPDDMPSFEDGPAKPKTVEDTGLGERLGFGFARGTNLLENVAAELEQKATPKREARTVDTFEQGDLPNIDAQGNVVMDTQSVRTGERVIPAITEQSIQAEQATRKNRQLASDFPELYATDEDLLPTSVSVGSFGKLITDPTLVLAPIKAGVALGAAVRGGTMLSTSAGKALTFNAIKEGAVVGGAFSLSELVAHDAATNEDTDLMDAIMMTAAGAAGGGVINRVLPQAAGKIGRWVSAKIRGGEPMPSIVQIKEQIRLNGASGEAFKVPTGAEIDAAARAIQAQGVALRKQVMGEVQRVNKLNEVNAENVDSLMTVTEAPTKAAHAKRAAQLVQTFKKDADVGDQFLDEAIMADVRRLEEATGTKLGAAGNTPEVVRPRGIERQDRKVQRALAAKGLNLNQVAKGVADADELMRQGRIDVLRSRAQRNPNDPAVLAWEQRSVRNAQLEEARVLEAVRALQKKAEPTVQKVAKVKEQARPVFTTITSNPDLKRNAQGKVSAWLRYANKVYQRIADIDPALAIAIRRQTVGAQTRKNALITEQLPFIDMLRKNQKNGVWRQALENGDVAAMNRLVRRSGDLYQQHAAPYLALVAQQRKAGNATVRADYAFPRAVRSQKAVENLRTQLGREHTTALDSEMDAIIRKQGRPMDVEQMAALFSRKIHNRGGGAMDRSRRIDAIPLASQKHYEDPLDAYLGMLERHEDNVSVKSLLDNFTGQPTDMGSTITHEKLVDALARSVKEGNLLSGDMHELAELLGSQLGVSRSPSNAGLQTWKNIVTGSTLGIGPNSTLTQIADFGAASYFGRVNAVKAFIAEIMPGTVGEDVYKAGIRSLVDEMRTPHGTAKYVQKTLQVNGFNKLDKLGSKVMTGAARKQRLGQLRKDPVKLKKELTKLFGSEEDAIKIMDDLRAGRLTDDVNTLVAHDVAGLRPLSREDLPLYLQKNPNGRFLGTLMTWSINQMNLYRNNVLGEFKRGNKVRAVKNLAGLAVMFGMANVPAGLSKDVIFGRELDPVKHFQAGALGMGMMGKYVVTALLSGQPERALANMAPIFSLTANAMSKAFMGVVDTDVRKVLSAFPGLDNLINAVPAAAAIGGAVVEGASNMLPEAQAGTRQFENVRAAPSTAREAGPSAPLQSGPLPQGTQDLLPERSQTDVDIARLQQATVQAIESEQRGDQTTEAPVPASNKLSVQMGTAKELLALREGDESVTYQNKIADGNGGTKLDKPTAGIGHVLSAAELKLYPVDDESKPVPRAVIDRWFKKDVAKAFAAAQRQAKRIKRPDMVAALTSMNFQNGTEWAKVHPSTWEFMTQGDWTSAAAEAADSLWYEQTPKRVKDLQKALLKGIKD